MVTGGYEPGYGPVDDAMSPKDRACPNCGAGPGSPCKRPSGHAVFGGGFHAARKKEKPVTTQTEEPGLFCDLPEFLAAVERVIDCSAIDDSRPVLTGAANHERRVLGLELDLVVQQPSRDLGERP